MCRLGGVVLTQRPRTLDKYTQITEDLLGLLVKMEDALGGDGNGLSFHYPNGEYRIIKDHRKVNRLFGKFEEIRQNLIDGAVIVQMHSRLSTGGDSKYHENLHPFTHEPIIGCHNGQVEDMHIWDDLARLNMKPYSVVDSEAIFASLSAFSNTLRPKQVQYTIDDLWGTYAITAVSQKKPNMLFMMRQENPLCYWNNRKEGEIWYASTSDLFPETLGIPEKTVKKTYKYGKNKGKTYKSTERDVVKLHEGDGVYFRATKRRVRIEKNELDVWAE